MRKRREVLRNEFRVKRPIFASSFSSASSVLLKRGRKQSDEVREGQRERKKKGEKINPVKIICTLSMPDELEAT